MMINLKNIVNKPVLSINCSSLNDNFEFIVTNSIVIDRYMKKIRYLILSNGKNIYYLDIKNIYSFGEDAIIIKDFSKLIEKKDFSLLSTQFCININAKIYNLSGNLISKLIDVVIKDSKNFVFILDNKNISICDKKIVSTSKNTIIVDKKIVKKSKKIENIKSKQILPPNTSLANTSFLYGKIVTRDIVGLSGEIIIKKNSIINSNIIQKAKNNFKMQELILNSKNIILG